MKWDRNANLLTQLYIFMNFSSTLCGIFSNKDAEDITAQQLRQNAPGPDR